MNATSRRKPEGRDQTESLRTETTESSFLTRRLDREDRSSAWSRKTSSEGVDSVEDEERGGFEGGEQVGRWGSRGTGRESERVNRRRGWQPGVDESYEPEGLSMVADSTSEPEAGCGGRRRGFKWKLRPIRRNRRHGYRRLRPPACMQTFRTNVHPSTHLHPLFYVFKYIVGGRAGERASERANERACERASQPASQPAS